MGLGSTHQALVSLVLRALNGGGHEGMLSGGIEEGAVVIEEGTVVFSGDKPFTPVLHEIGIARGCTVVVLAKGVGRKIDRSCPPINPKKKCLVVVFDEPTAHQIWSWHCPASSHNLKRLRVVDVGTGQDGKLHILRREKPLPFEVFHQTI